MHVSNINAINFNAGKVRLDKIDSKDLFRLNEIKEIAKNKYDSTKQTNNIELPIMPITHPPVR